MRNSISPNRFLLLFACLLLLVTPLRAQDGDPSALEDTRDRAWLGVSIDPHGAATVSLEVPAKVRDRKQLKQALAEKAFSGGRMQTTCEIDLQSLLLHLQQHHIDYLKVWVVFQNGTQNVQVNGAERIPIEGSLNLDHYEAEINLQA